jgi:hypothetical protein
MGGIRSWRRIIGLMAVGLALVLVGASLTNLWPRLNPFGTDTVDRSQPVLLQAVRDLSQYHAAVGEFQVIIDVEQDVRFVPDVLAGQRTLFVGAGTVNAYVDFSTLRSEALTVSPDTKTVQVRLPEAKLDKPNLDPSRSYVYAQERGALNQISDFLNGSDQRQFYVLAEERIAAAAAASPLRQQAANNTRAMLTGLLSSLGYQTNFSQGT